MKHWLVIAAAVSLAACGSDDDSVLGSAGPIPPPLDGTSSGTPIPPPGGGGPGTATFGSGFWIDDSSGFVDMVALVTEEGDFAMFSGFEGGGVRDFFGDDGFEDATLNTNANTYVGFAPATNASIQGTIVEGVSINGSYSAGGGSIPFSLRYVSSLFERGASLATLAGTYSAFDGTLVVVETDGELDVDLANGCTISGTVTVPQPDRNYYRFSGSLSDCGGLNGAVRGLMYLMDDSPGTNNVVALIGETNSRSASVYAEAVR